MSCDKSLCQYWCLWPCLRAWSAGTLAQEVSKPLWVGFPLHLPRPLGLRGSCPVGRVGAGKQVAGTTVRWSAASDSTIAPRRHNGSVAVAVAQEQQGPCAAGYGV